MSEAEDTYVPRMRTKYEKESVPALMKRFGYTNNMQVHDHTFRLHSCLALNYTG